MADDRLFTELSVERWSDDFTDSWATYLPGTRYLNANITIISSTAEPESPFAIGYDERLWCKTATGLWASELLHHWAGTWPIERFLITDIPMTSSTSNDARHTFGDVRSITADIAMTSSVPSTISIPQFIIQVTTDIALTSSTGDAETDILVVMNQEDRARLGFGNSRLLIDISVGTDTFRLSHDDFTYDYGAETLHYASFLINISGLGEFLSTDGEGFNSRIVLTLADEAYGSYDYLSQWVSAVQFAGSVVSIYEIRLISDDETFQFDVRTLLHKMAVERVSNLRPGISLDLECSSRLFAKRNSHGSEVLTKSRYPFCDPNDLGKPRSILYGDLYHVPCRCVRAGAIDLMSGDLSEFAYDTTIYLSGVRQLEFTGPPYVIRIDDEQIYCPSLPVNHIIYGAIRGWNGTTVTKHVKAAAVMDYLSSVIYEVAKHPVQSISAVRVLDVAETLYPSSGHIARAYTGKSGDEHPSYPGVAVLDFNLPAFVQKRIDQKVASEHTHTDVASTATSTDTSQGSHSHTTSSLSTLTKRGVSATYSGVTNPQNVYDYSDLTYATLNPSSTGNHLTVKLESGGAGTLSKIMVRAKVRHASGPSGNNLKITCNSSTLYESNQLLMTDTDGLWLGWQLTTSTWPTTVVFGVSANSGSHVNYDIYELEVDHYYTPAVDAGPASGVASTSASATNAYTYIQASSILGGLTVADVLIGEEVTVDVKGYEDSDGSITGVIGTLIERPDHVIKHALIKLLGFSASDIGGHITYEAAAWFYLRSWKFAFIVHDIGESMDSVLQLISAQCCCSLTDWAGLIDAKPVLVSPASVYRWDFADSLEGWTAGGGCMLGSATSYAAVYYSGGAQYITRDGLSIPGPIYNQVVARIKRVSGSGWNGGLYYSTPSHGYSYSYGLIVGEPSGLSDWVEVTWDMTKLGAGGADWISNTITGLDLQLGSAFGDFYHVDWIEVRSSESPLPHTRLNWDFSDLSSRGWLAGGTSALATGASYATLTSTGGDPMFYYYGSAFGFYGRQYSRVVARIRRTSGSGWDGTVYYNTSSHSYSASYRKTISEPPGSSGWVDAEWDMTVLTQGGGDWYGSWITGIRIDLGSTASDVFQIESIRIEPDKRPLEVLSDMLLEVPTFRWSGTADSKTALRAFHSRDYRGTTGRGQVIVPDVPGDAFARGYMDCIDAAWSPVDGPGKFSVDLELKAIRNPIQAREVQGVWGRKWGYPTITVNMRLNWMAIELSPGDAIDYTCPVLGRKYYRVIEMHPDPVSRKISITAEAWI